MPQITCCVIKSIKEHYKTIDHADKHEPWPWPWPCSINDLGSFFHNEVGLIG